MTRERLLIIYIKLLENINFQVERHPDKIYIFSADASFHVIDSRAPARLEKLPTPLGTIHYIRAIPKVDRKREREVCRNLYTLYLRIIGR